MREWSPVSWCASERLSIHGNAALLVKHDLPVRFPPLLAVHSHRTFFDEPSTRLGFDAEDLAEEVVQPHFLSGGVSGVCRILAARRAVCTTEV